LQIGASFDEAHTTTGISICGTNPAIRIEIQRASGGAAASFFRPYLYNTTSALNVKAGEIGVYGTMNTDPTPPSAGYLFFGAHASTAFNDTAFRINATKLCSFDTALSIGLLTNSATVHIKGSGTTSATTAFRVDNSSNTNLFQINDAGTVLVNTTTTTDPITGTSKVKAVDGTMQLSFRDHAAGQGWLAIGNGTMTGYVGQTATAHGFTMGTYTNHATTLKVNNNAIFHINTDKQVYLGDMGVGGAVPTISAKLHVKGLGATSATNGLRVENSSLVETFSVRNDGLVQFDEFVSAKTADYTVLNTEKKTLFTNTGATGTVNFTLPTAAAGLHYKFYCNAAQSIRVTAGASDVIRRGASVTAAAGNVLTPAALGNYFEVVAIDAVTWVITQSVETSAYTFT
jgi:hypothetical protein